jgi:hypothetical protein
MPNYSIILFHFTDSRLAIEKERDLMMVIFLMMPIPFSTQQVLRPLPKGRGEEKEKLDPEEAQDHHWSLLLEKVLLEHLWQLPFSSFVRTYWDSSAHRYSSMLSSSYFLHTAFVILPSLTHTIEYIYIHNIISMLSMLRFLSWVGRISYYLAIQFDTCIHDHVHIPT